MVCRPLFLSSAARKFSTLQPNSRNFKIILFSFFVIVWRFRRLRRVIGLAWRCTAVPDSCFFLLRGLVRRVKGGKNAEKFIIGMSKNWLGRLVVDRSEVKRLKLNRLVSSPLSGNVVPGERSII